MDDAPILICYDGSADSDRATEAAAALLGPRRAAVVDIGPTLTRRTAGEMALSTDRGG